MRDIPFKLYLTKNIDNIDEKNIYIIDENYFKELSRNFQELTNIKTYNDPIKNLSELFINGKYNLVLELNNNSKYINHRLYKLNNCVKFFCELQKDNNEEGENEVITLKNCFELFRKEMKLKKGDEWFCPKCKKHVLANKKMEIYYSPKILITFFYLEKNNELISHRKHGYERVYSWS